MPQAGIMFGFYYSILDFYQYDYVGYGTVTPNRAARIQADRKPDFERYVSYMKAELKELIQNYGIEILIPSMQLDPSWTHDRGSDCTATFAVSIALLISNRSTPRGSEEARISLR